MKRLALILLLAAPLASCAVGPAPLPGSAQPTARMSLQPEYRVFYDALVDYGDWILIEPAGFVFRPRVNFDAWEPYSNGFWAPSDPYGWVWVSSEPYGWATYHYGRWFYDDYQGWVWQPGVDWGPAWVSWSTNDVYLGWAPLPPAGSLGDALRGWSWVPVSQIADRDLSTRIVKNDQIAQASEGARPIVNVDEVEGVRFNRGPEIRMIEERTGPLARVKIEDLVPSDGTLLGELPRDTTPTEGPPSAPILVARRAGERAARAAVQAQKGGALPQVPMVRPFGVHRERTAPGRPQGLRPQRRVPAGSDSLTKN